MGCGKEPMCRSAAERIASCVPWHTPSALQIILAVDLLGILFLSFYLKCRSASAVCFLGREIAHPLDAFE